MRALKLFLSLAISFFLGSGGARAEQPQTLVELGTFGRVFSAPPETFGVETYEVNWDENQLAGLLNTTALPWLCSSGTPVVSQCVREIRINMRSTKLYSKVYLLYERAGAEVDEIIFDNNKVGGVAAQGDQSGSVTVAEGQWVTVSFGLGVMTPRKTYTLIIRSPDKGLGEGRFSIGGIRVVGVSHRQ